MKRIVTRSFRVVQNGRAYSYEMGMILTPAKERQLTKTQLRDYTQLKETKRTRYSKEELETIVRLYLEDNTRSSFVQRFNQVHIGNTHTSDSVELMHQHLFSWDVYNKDTRQKELSTQKTLRKIAMDKEPNRF